MKIIACGDLALCGRIEKMVSESRSSEVAKDFRDILANADIFLADLECPLTNSETSGFDFPTLKASCGTGLILKELGVDVVSLANNHIADYGLRGLKDTIATIEDLGISWSGAGHTPNEACKPLILKNNDLSIGILALAQPEHSAAKSGKWGAGVLEYEAAKTAMKLLVKQVDVAIAYLHFGVEFSCYPTPDQVVFCRALVDAGAQLVIGHHPHVPQGYEFYKNGFIAYSLGNFIFDMKPGPQKFSRMGLLVEAEISDQKKLKRVNVIPVNVESGNPSCYNSKDTVDAYHYLDELCSVLKSPDKLNNKYYFTCRDNLEMHINAAFSHLKKLKIKRLIGSFSVQLRPQIFKLRVDLILFLFTGEAMQFEKTKKSYSKEFKAILWNKVCLFCWLLGLGWFKKLTKCRCSEKV